MFCIIKSNKGSEHIFDYTCFRIHGGVDMTRRQRVIQLRRRVAMLIGATILIILFVVLAFAFSSKAKDNTETLNKYYKSITIEYGASLYSIACEYSETSMGSIEDYINEVRSINHLSEEDDIYSGQNLIVPYYSYDFNL